MKPAWFAVNALPFEHMWPDAPHWLPHILAGERVRMRFIYNHDNATLEEIHTEVFGVDDGR
jgi:8-oxo-dGTP diphosphatase